MEYLLSGVIYPHKYILRNTSTYELQKLVKVFVTDDLACTVGASIVPFTRVLDEYQTC